MSPVVGEKQGAAAPPAGGLLLRQKRLLQGSGSASPSPTPPSGPEVQLGSDVTTGPAPPAAAEAQLRPGPSWTFRTSAFALPAALLLLVLPGVLPGPRPADVFPLVQILLLQLLQREKKNPNKRLTDFSFRMENSPHQQKASTSIKFFSLFT